MPHETRSNPSQAVSATLVDVAPPRSSRVVRWLVVLLTVAIVALPLTYREMPKEIVRWQFAAAAEARLVGDNAQATALIDAALQTDSTSLPMLLQRARWRMQDGDFAGAVEDLSHLLVWNPNAVGVYTLRASALQHLQRHDDAIADADRLFAECKRAEGYSADESLMREWLRFLHLKTRDERGLQLARARNGLAYTKAVANRDLDEALADIKNAIDVTQRIAPHDVPMMLDTRGFILYRLGDYQAALEDLQLAVAELDSPLVDDWRAYATKSKYGDRHADPREVQVLWLEEKEKIAVLRYHRMLIHNALGQTAEAEADRRRVLELGFEPGDQLF